MRNEKYKIKQMMPIPDGYEVMSLFHQEDGSEKMEATVETVFSYCLVLVEDDEIGDWIGLYEIAPGMGSVVDDVSAILVPTKHCPRCGKRLVPHMNGADETTLHYLCDCGYNSETAENDGQ